MYSHKDNIFRYKYSCYLLTFRYIFATRGCLCPLHFLGIFVIWKIVKPDEMTDFLYHGRALAKLRELRLGDRRASLENSLGL